jgi:hypothetical protein
VEGRDLSDSHVVKLLMKDQASTTVMLTLESESLGSGEASRGAVAAALWLMLE